MREIKYRAYIKNNERVPSEVSKVVDVKSLHLGSKKAIIGFSKNKSNYGNYSVPFDDIDLMEYTGLKDINGIDIYEGDIVQEENRYVNSDKLFLQKIQWKESYSCWLRGEYERLTPANIKKFKIKVVGNIYDNPDLINENE